MQKQPITVISTLKELKNPIKKIMGFSSICLALLLIFLGLYKFYLNPLTYINFYPTSFSARDLTVVAWLTYGLIYLRRFYPYQWPFILIPLLYISDALWNPLALFTYNIYFLPTILNIHWAIYEIEFISLVALTIIIFKPKLSSPNDFQLTILIAFLLIYSYAGVPIVVDFFNNTTIAINVWWELVWQIIMILVFGTIFTKGKPVNSIRWLFN